MNTERVFTNVTDLTISELIDKATQRVVYIAPGVSKIIADVFVKKLDSFPIDKITIVLDADPETCRMGYGDIEGLEQIKKVAEQKGMLIYNQTGIRIGIIIVDDATLVFSPTPLLIEAGSKSPDKPNGLLFSGSAPQVLEQTIVTAIHNREFSGDIISNQDLEKAKKDLKTNPPKKFDVARFERVFNSRIQYVEFSFEEYRLSQKIVPIPPELTGISKNKEIVTRWRNSFMLFDGKTEIETGSKDDEKNPPISEKSLEKEKKAIIDEFLLMLPRHGTFILRCNKQSFEERIKGFKDNVEKFRKGIQEKLAEQLLSTKNKLVKELIPHVISTTPPSWRSTMLCEYLSKKEAYERLQKALKPIFLNVNIFFNPKVSVTFKDVTYETIHNEDFRKELKKRFPEAAYNTLFKEYDAAPEINTEQQRGLKPV